MKPPDLSGRSDPLGEFQRKQRTGLLTLLFTDIVGSGKIKQALGDSAGVALIQQHEQIVRRLLGHFPDAQVIDTAGDSFFILFVRPSDAVVFALRLQTALRALAKDRANPVLDRIGIHIGEVIVQEGEGAAKRLAGAQVDACARIMSLADTDQILLSRAAFDNARQVLKGNEIEGLKELAWLNHGPYLLKGMEESIEICEVGETSLACLKAPAGSEKAQRQASPDAEPVLGWRPALGQVVPNTKWVLEKKLGEGGFGEVWLGRHQAMKERRVFKFCFRADRVRSLKREMTLFRLLKERVGDHPNIVALRDVYFDEAPFYVVMDHVEGQDLKAWCEQQGGVGNVPLEVRLVIVAQIADALQAAHDAGVIHRDVKPGNILVAGVVAAPVKARAGLSSESMAVLPNESEPAPSQAQLRVQAKLTDFGIGQVVSEEALRGMTKAGFTQTILAESSSSQTGSQMYMAPELLAGKPASTRSDIYSLGVVLYQLLASDFTRPLTTDWADHIADPLLRDDLKHCFAGNPQDRFLSVGQLAKQLRQLPERRAELERQQAELAALERAAYRRGMIRTAGIAAMIVVLISVLAVFAFNATRNLRRNLYFADIFAAGEALSANDPTAAKRVVENYRHRRPWEEEFRGLEYRWLWTQCQSEELAPLAFHTNGALCAVISPGGKWLATGGRDETVNVVDFATRKLVVSLRGFFDGGMDTRAVAFSPDGRFLAAQGGTRVVVWSTSTWKRVAQLQGKPNWNSNTSVVFSPDSQTLATRIHPPGEPLIGGRGAVGFWQTVDWTPRRPLIGTNASDGLGTVLTYSLDGSWLACSMWNELQIRDAKSLVLLTNLVRSVHPVNRVLSVALSSQHMAVGHRDGMLTLWELGAWHEVARVRAHESFLLALAFSSDGKVVATGGDDPAIKLWNVPEMLVRQAEPETVLPRQILQGHVGQLRSLEFAADGRTLVSASEDGAVKMWSVPSMASEDLPGGWERLPRWFSQNGDALIIELRAGPKAERRLKRLDRVREIETDLPVQPAQVTDSSAYAISPDGKHLAVGKKDGAVELWPVDAPGVPQVLPGDGREINALTFAPQGGLLAGGRGDEGAKSFRVWDLNSGQSVIEFKNVDRDLVFSPDGTRLAGADTRGSLKVWQARTGQEVASLDANLRRVYAIAFSPDGRWLAFAGWSDQGRLWKIGTPVVESIGGPNIGLSSLVFSPNGRTLIGKTWGNLIHFWDVRSRTLLLRVRNDRAGGNFLLLSPDAKVLAVRSRKREMDLELWRFPTLVEIDAAEKAKALSK